MKLVIIGSGPTALGAAYRINQLIEEGVIAKDTQVVVLEKESEVGGLARSVTDDRGFTWDLGVHVTGVSRYVKFTQVINQAVEHWNIVPRCVKAYMKQVIGAEDARKNYVPYPVQDSIPYFPDEIRQRCLAEIEATADSSEANNFAEFAEYSFGQTLLKEFIRPYNEKVWTVPLEDMNCSWVEGRVPSSNLLELRRKCKMTVDELIAEDEAKEKLKFKYPRDLLGVGEMWSIVASTMPSEWFVFNTAVKKIDPIAKKVYIAEGKYTTYDHIISTIPIVELGKMTGLLPDIKLRHSKVVLIGIGMRRPQPEFTEPLSWLYFPQPETTFYRCTFLSNFNEQLTPNAALFWSVICEIGIKADQEADQEQLVENTIRDLLSHGIIEDASLIIDKWVHILPFGYPIPTLNRDEELQKAHEVLHKNDIYSRGRFGSWKYEVANQDHSFTMGMEVVDRILIGGHENLFP